MNEDFGQLPDEFQIPQVSPIETPAAISTETMERSQDASKPAQEIFYDDREVYGY